MTGTGRWPSIIVGFIAIKTFANVDTFGYRYRTSSQMFVVFGSYLVVKNGVLNNGANVIIWNLWKLISNLLLSGFLEFGTYSHDHLSLL